MFGFGNTKEDSVKKTANKAAIYNTFGSTDVDNVLKEYMPELSNAILTASEKAKNIDRNLIQNGKNQIAIANDILSGLQELKKQNLELQKKYDAVLERMDKILAREEGKGR